jgi:transposase-like protein
VQWLAHGPVRLAIDWTIEGPQHLLVVSFIVGRRAVPIYWRASDAVVRKGRMKRYARVVIRRAVTRVIRLIANVKQKTIEPFIKDTIAAGTHVYTDEYSIYAHLQSWGYDHKRVNHGRGEFARDEDGDGFCEVHVNTMEGLWSPLRSWLRPHRGISQEKLPLYLGFFEFVHNVRKQGKALLGALIEVLII